MEVWIQRYKIILNQFSGSMQEIQFMWTKFHHLYAVNASHYISAKLRNPKLFYIDYNKIAWYFSEWENF